MPRKSDREKRWELETERWYRVGVYASLIGGFALGATIATLAGVEYPEESSNWAAEIVMFVMSVGGSGAAYKLFDYWAINYHGTE